MEWGLTKGLAVDLGYDKRIEDAKYFEQQQKQKEAMDIAKAKMFADDIDFVNGSNAYDAAKIKDYTKSKIGELASLAKSNPSWASDPNTLLRMKEIKNDIKGNEHVLRSIAYKDAKEQHAKILEEAASNKGAYDEEDLKSINRQFEDYAKRDVAEQQGAFVYSPPTKMWDLNEVYRKMGDSYEPDEKVDVRNGRLGAYVMKPSERGLEEKARMVYERNPEQFRKYVRAGLDPVQAIKSEFRGFVKPKSFEGYENVVGNAMAIESHRQRLKQAYEKLNKDPNYDVYKETVVDAKDIPITDSNTFAETFGSTPTVTYKGVDGKDIQEDGNEFHYTRLQDANKLGLKIASGFITKPIDFGIDGGIVREKHFWESGDEPYVVKPELRDAYSIHYPNPNNKGEGEPILQIKARAVINANDPAAARKYNNKIKSTNDQKNAEGYGGSRIEREVYEDRVGNLFTKDAKGNTIPYEE